MILSFINNRKVPREVLKTKGEVLKTSGSTPGLQHFPRDLANNNEWINWKIMFNSSIEASCNSVFQPKAKKGKKKAESAGDGETVSCLP